MKALCVLVVMAGVSAAQPDEKTWQVFVPGDIKNLKEDQKKRYDDVAKQPWTKGVAVYRLNNLYGSVEFAKKVDVQFAVNGNKVEILGCTSKKGTITLDKEGNDFVYLTVNGPSVHGIIRRGGKKYGTHPLGNFWVAIIEIDDSKFPPD